MPPQAISFAISLLQMVLANAPEIAAEIKALLTKAEPTSDDWNALHAKVAAKSYLDYVPASALSAARPVTVLPSPATPGTVTPPGASQSGESQSPSATPAPAVTPVAASVPAPVAGVEPNMSISPAE